MSDQLREWQMGSFYWPGLRDGDWYSMTKRSGEGANIKLEIVNQSGLDRMQRSWSDTVAVAPVDTVKDTAVVDTAAHDSSDVDQKDTSMSIAFGGLPVLDLVQPAAYTVFGVTGKFLGEVEITGAHSVHEISLGLKSAGFAQGVYFVRGTAGMMRVRVR